MQLKHFEQKSTHLKEKYVMSQPSLLYYIYILHYCLLEIVSFKQDLIVDDFFSSAIFLVFIFNNV